MQQIKKKFKVCYDEKNSPLKLQQFITFEMALMVAHISKQVQIRLKAIFFLPSIRIFKEKGTDVIFI